MHCDPYLPGQAPEDRLATEPPSFREEPVEHYAGNKGGDECDDHDDVHDGIDRYFSHGKVIGTDPILNTWGLH